MTFTALNITARRATRQRTCRTLHGFAKLTMVLVAVRAVNTL
jgi:hypothetical protein